MVGLLAGYLNCFLQSSNTCTVYIFHYLGKPSSKIIINIKKRNWEWNLIRSEIEVYIYWIIPDLIAHVSHFMATTLYTLMSWLLRLQYRSSWVQLLKTSRYRLCHLFMIRPTATVVPRSQTLSSVHYIGTRVAAASSFRSVWLLPPPQPRTNVTVSNLAAVVWQPVDGATFFSVTARSIPYIRPCVPLISWLDIPLHLQVQSHRHNFLYCYSIYNLLSDSQKILQSIKVVLSLVL